MTAFAQSYRTCFVSGNIESEAPSRLPKLKSLRAMDSREVSLAHVPLVPSIYGPC